MKVSYSNLIKNQPLAFSFSTILQILLYLLPLATAILIKALFDSIIGTESSGLTPLQASVGILVTYLLAAFFDYASAYQQMRFVLGSQAFVRETFMTELYKPGIAVSISAGDAANRLNHDVEEITWFTSFVTTAISFGIFAIVAFSYMLLLHPIISIIVVLPFVVVSFVSHKVQKRFLWARQDLKNVSTEISEILSDIADNSDAILSSKVRRTVFEHFKHLDIRRKRLAMIDSMVSYFSRNSNKILSTLALGGIVVILVAQQGTFGLNAGLLTFFLYLINWLGKFSLVIGEFLAWKQRASISLKRINRAFSLFPIGEIKRDPYQKSLISLEKISIPIGANNSLKIDSFDVKPNEKIVVVGKNKTGKTLLAKSILGMHPKSGETIINAKLKIAYVAQNPKLIEGTIIENLYLSSESNTLAILHQHHLSRCLKVSNLELKEFEEGLLTQVGTKAAKVSGGQKQRIALCRALLCNSDILVLDDFVSDLDEETKKSILKNISSLNDVAVLCFTSDESYMNYFEKIYTVEEGRLIPIKRIQIQSS